MESSSFLNHYLTFCYSWNEVSFVSVLGSLSSAIFFLQYVVYFVVQFYCVTHYYYQCVAGFFLPSCTNIFVKLEETRVCSLYLRGISFSSLSRIVCYSIKNFSVFMILLWYFNFFFRCFAQLNVFLCLVLEIICFFVYIIVDWILSLSQFQSQNTLWHFAHLGLQAYHGSDMWDPLVCECGSIHLFIMSRIMHVKFDGLVCFLTL